MAVKDPEDRNKTLQVSREMYKDLVRVNLNTGLSMLALTNFIAELVLGAFEKRIPGSSLKVPEGFELPKRPAFTASSDKPLPVHPRTHRKLKRVAEPLNMSISYIVEASWPYLRKYLFALPPARWANEVTMMNNVIGAAARDRARFEEAKVREEMEAKGEV